MAKQIYTEWCDDVDAGDCTDFCQVVLFTAFHRDIEESFVAHAAQPVPVQV